MERKTKYEQRMTSGMTLSQNSKQIENQLRQVECKLKHAIGNLTTCLNCFKLFSIDNPAVILECGHTVCRYCYYSLNSNSQACCKGRPPVKQGEIVINHQIQDNIELLRHVDNTSTLKELGVPKSVQCFATNKHLVLPSDSIVPCHVCAKIQICLRCEDCDMNFCSACKEHSLTKEQCLHGHFLQYRTEKAMCIGCNKQVNAIFTCQTFPAYKICYNCEGFTKFASKVCQMDEN